MDRPGKPQEKNDHTSGLYRGHKNDVRASKEDHISEIRVLQIDKLRDKNKLFEKQGGYEVAKLKRLSEES